MAASINLTAAVMMVLHAVLGCCWHHTHALATTDVVGMVAPPTSCCSHSHHDHESPAPASDDEHDDCDEHACSVIAVVPTSVATPNPAWLPAEAWFAPVDLAASALTLDAASHSIVDVAHRGPPHVPLRLLLGVLRI